MFHFDAVVQEMIINGIWETLYMTLASTFMGYVLGLPLGIALAVTDKTGIRPQPVVYRVLDVISNVLRSDSAYQIYRGAVLWLFGYSRTTGYRCRSFYWTYGGIIAQGSRSWRDRGCSEHGRRHLYDHLESIARRSKNILDRRCDDRTWYNPWILRNGRRCRRRRSGKYRNSVWLLSLSAGYHDRNDRYFDCPRSNFAGNWNVDLCKA